jgi:rubrerythrin
MPTLRRIRPARPERIMDVPAMRPDLRLNPRHTDKVRIVSTSQQANAAETAAAAAAFLAAQEITTTECRQCGTQVSGVNGRYSCPSCGWSNPWTEGHRKLPSAQDDPDWPGRKKTA